MRRIYAIMLLSVFLLHTAVMVGYVSYFYAYRAEIAAKYCINKANAASDCRGCCHLTKTIQKMNLQDENSSENSTPEMKIFEFEWMSLGSIVKCENSFVFECTYPEIQTLSVRKGVTAIELPPPRC
jgi:hypothetical protein